MDTSSADRGRVYRVATYVDFFALSLLAQGQRHTLGRIAPCSTVRMTKLRGRGYTSRKCGARSGSPQLDAEAHSLA